MTNTDETASGGEKSKARHADSSYIEALSKKIARYQKSYYQGEAEISDAEFDSLWDELKEICPEHPILRAIGSDIDSVFYEDADSVNKAGTFGVESGAFGINNGDSVNKAATFDSKSEAFGTNKKNVETAVNAKSAANVKTANNAEAAANTGTKVATDETAVSAGGTFAKARHIMMMGSQEKASDPNQFLQWAQKHDYGEYLVEYKLDGASLELQYQNGAFTKAVTRGDGTVGEDITQNALKMKGVVLQIDATFTGAVRGEVIMSHAVHRAHFSDKANCRNAANGLMKRKDGSGSEHLEIICYDAFYAGSGAAPFTDEMQKTEWLTQNGFACVPVTVCKTAADVIDYRAHVMQIRSSLPYDIDGLVIKNRAIDIADSLRARPDKQIAFKFSLEEAVTVLRRVIWNENGATYTPIGEFDTVELAGTKVQRASLVNPNTIASLGICIGSHVVVTKRGEIIPKIEAVVKEYEDAPTAAAEPSENGVTATRTAMSARSENTAKNAVISTAVVGNDAAQTAAELEKAIDDSECAAALEKVAESGKAADDPESAAAPDSERSVSALGNARANPSAFDDLPLFSFSGEAATSGTKTSCNTKASAQNGAKPTQDAATEGASEVATSGTTSATESAASYTESVGTASATEGAARFTESAGATSAAESASEAATSGTTSATESAASYTESVGTASATEGAARFTESAGVSSVSAVRFTESPRTDCASPSAQNTHLVPIAIPDTCTTCGSSLVNEGTRLYCPNHDCPKRLLHQITKWISVIDIRDLGETLIRSLFASGDVTSVSDLYRLSESTLTRHFLNEESIEKEKVSLGARKVLASIQKSRTMNLATFIAGFDIEGIGETMAEKLVSSGFDTLQKLFDATETDIARVYGFADISAHTFVQGIGENRAEMQGLVSSGTIQLNETTSEGALSGKSFCFTGELYSLKRADAEKLVKEKGGTCKSSVTKDLSFLVTNDTQSGSSKNKKAQSLGIPIIDEAHFLALVQDAQQSS